MDRREAEKELTKWALSYAKRDFLVREAYAAGVPKIRIYVITGIARTTIDRIVHNRLSTEDSDNGYHFQ